MNLICLACSATKRDDPGMMPAIDRYDGVMWRTLRAALAANGISKTDEERLQIWFLSARYGFQLARLPIPDYEHRLTDRPGTMGNDGGFRRCVEAADAVLFAGGQLYRDLMVEAAGYPLIYSATWGGIGSQRKQLRNWIAEHCR